MGLPVQWPTCRISGPGKVELAVPSQVALRVALVSWLRPSPLPRKIAAISAALCTSFRHSARVGRQDAATGSGVRGLAGGKYYLAGAAASGAIGLCMHAGCLGFLGILRLHVQ